MRRRSDSAVACYTDHSAYAALQYQLLPNYSSTINGANDAHGRPPGRPLLQFATVFGFKTEDVMQMEINMPMGIVKTPVVNYVRENLLELYRRHRQITGARVLFRETGEHEKILYIELEVSGHPWFMRRQGRSFEKLSREAIKELSGKLPGMLDNDKHVV